MLKADRLTEEERLNAEDRRTGRTYARCRWCGRIFAAYGKNGRVWEHRLDTHPDFRVGGERYGQVPPNTPCPGARELGNIVEGEIYTSPTDTLKWYRVQ